MLHSTLTGTHPSGFRSCSSQWNIPYVERYATFHVLSFTPDLQGSTFTMVDRVISLAVSLHHSQSIQPKLSIDNRVIISKMMKTVSSSSLSNSGKLNFPP
jgi:hypothetical protein